VLGVGALLSARRLTAVLPGDIGSVGVLDGIALDVAVGEIVDVTGPSGSGKSTLLRALARLLPGATGELVLDGVSARTIAPADWRTKVALVPQKPVLVGGTIRENLLLPWTFAVRVGDVAPDDEAMSDGLARLGVEAALDRPADRLSVGQIARVALLRTLLTSPRVLLLDEPDAALDEASAGAVTAMTAEFAESGNAVVRVRHRAGADGGSRRVRISAGRLAEELA
jgi:putative ABC transport system ATP-binding protein